MRARYYRYIVLNNFQMITMNIVIYKASHTPLAYFHRYESRKMYTLWCQFCEHIQQQNIILFFTQTSKQPRSPVDSRAKTRSRDLRSVLQSLPITSVIVIQCAIFVAALMQSHPMGGSTVGRCVHQFVPG